MITICLKAGGKRNDNMSLPDNIQNKKLRRIAEKICNNIPASKEDALYMLTTHDILDLGTIAHYIRTKLHGDIAYYGVNMNLNYTNICELRCPLCAFSCDENDENAFSMTLSKGYTVLRVQGLMKSILWADSTPILPLTISRRCCG
jgi:hypothetical protein